MPQFCDKHKNCIVQYDGEVCPICSEIQELEERIENLNLGV